MCLFVHCPNHLALYGKLWLYLPNFKSPFMGCHKWSIMCTNVIMAKPSLKAPRSSFELLFIVYDAKLSLNVVNPKILHRKSDWRWTARIGRTAEVFTDLVSHTFGILYSWYLVFHIVHDWLNSHIWYFMFDIC